MHRSDPPADVLSGVFLLARELKRELGDLMAAEQWTADAGFRPPCMGVMSVVATCGPVSQRTISDRLGLDASDVVGVLDILEGAGLVERRRDPDDRRRHAVVLTEAGEVAAAKLAVLRSQAETRVLAGLEPDERLHLAELLHRAIRTTRDTSPAATSPAATGPAATSPPDTGPAATSPAATSPAATSPAATSPGATSPAEEPQPSPA